jgi:hypothetical protein
MALPFTGAYARRYSQPYSGNLVWGTGVNPVHMYYGSPPARLSPVRPLNGRPLPDGQLAETSQPWEALSDQIIPVNVWGYQPEDQPNTYVYYGERPDWSVPPQDSPVRIASDDFPAWTAPGAVNNAFRATRAGAHRLFRGKEPRGTYPIPTETVSEGWRNKPKGSPADAKPSDPVQYEMQTSMEQRYRTRTNVLSVIRGTDEPRSDIDSRVIGQRLKVYSGQERHYDMFPRQQTPTYERPFYYRTAGTGQADWMEPNEQWEINAVERTPPPDPYIGRYDGSDVTDYGYMGEDQFYA